MLYYDWYNSNIKKEMFTKNLYFLKVNCYKNLSKLEEHMNDGHDIHSITHYNN